MGEAKRVKVWDLPTRLFHWALAVLVLLQYGTAEWDWLDMDWHFRFGYATLALILFRIAWGFCGSRTSRFADFLRGPRAVLRYLSATFADREARTLGHNPLGGWSVLLMLLCVLLQVATGLFASDDITAFGPLNARVSEHVASVMTSIHKINQNVLLVLIALHVIAVVVHLVAKRDNLIAPMIHGCKRVAAAAPRMVSAWLALAIVVVAALIVWGIVAWGEVAAAY
jgi:cytochrome b